MTKSGDLPDIDAKSLRMLENLVAEAEGFEAPARDITLYVRVHGSDVVLDESEEPCGAVSDRETDIRSDKVFRSLLDHMAQHKLVERVQSNAPEESLLVPRDSSIVLDKPYYILDYAGVKILDLKGLVELRDDLAYKLVSQSPKAIQAEVYGDFRIDSEEISYEGKKIHLPKQLLDIALALIRARGNELSHNEIVAVMKRHGKKDTIFKPNDVSKRISALRKKLRGEKKIDHIRSVGNGSYKFVP